VEYIVSILSALGAGGILLFFVKRFFDKRDQKEELQRQEMADTLKEFKTSMDTLRLLAYSRMSEEIERLLSKGYATPAERRFLEELYDNYKAHGWNGDMDARLEKVHRLRTDHRPE